MKMVFRKWWLHAFILLSITIVSYAFWPTGKLSGLQKRIDSVIKTTYETGQGREIIFMPDESDVVIIISPPYAHISDLGKNIFNLDILGKIQSDVNAKETGHLFYLKQGKLIDHKLLSGLAEPVLGMATGKEVIFQISRHSTSGRPIKVEIVGQ